MKENQANTPTDADDVSIVRKMIDDTFGLANELSKANPTQPFTSEMRDDLAARGNVIFREISVLAGRVLNGETAALTLSEDFLGRLRTLLQDRPFETYSAWHVRDDISDDEIRTFIRNEDSFPFSWFDLHDITVPLKKFDCFRDERRKVDFSTPLSDSYHVYVAILNNLCYLTWCLAHWAKSAGATESGKGFLWISSVFQKRKKSPAPWFSEETLQRIFSTLDESLEDLRLSVDLGKLEDWATFRPVQLENYEKATAQ